MSKLSNANISLMYENLSACAHNQSLYLSSVVLLFVSVFVCVIAFLI